MVKPDRKESRRAGEQPELPILWIDRWYGRVALLLVGVVLLSCAYAPWSVFPLAWVGLVPWLIVVHRCNAQWKAFVWSWIAGFLFFLANMWWLYLVTAPGMIGLFVILAFQWGWAALILRGTGIITGQRLLPLRMLGAAGIWVATEYFRGSFPWNGLPWLYLGHTQSPFLSMIQLADATGVAGISFWVACINIAVAMLLMQRLNIARCTWMFVTLGVMLLAILSYGWFRIGETPNKLSPGIKVMVVQSNYPQSNSGDKGAAPNEIVDFHLNTTRKALTESGGGVDLVAWSETMMPPLNKSARLRARNFQSGEFWLDTHRAIQNLGNDFSTALIVGGTALDDWDKDLNFHKRFNSAFYYDTGGTSWDERYDKIHLVPFGEFIPFKEDFPPLYQLLMYFNPYGYDYTVSFGDSEKLTVFKTRDVRFVTPICFEDIDAWLVAQMFRSDNGKRADLIVNLTNDGWFCFNQMPQHLQAAIFRSIENRVPTARSVNTGISGFIDSVGRTHDTLASGVAGVSSSEVKIDSRYTLFTRHGEWFALTCVVWTSLLATSAVLRWALVRLAGKRND